MIIIALIFIGIKIISLIPFVNFDCKCHAAKMKLPGAKKHKIL